MANCHLKMLGQKTHTCSADMPLQECTGSFPDDRSYNTYNEQLAQIDRCFAAALRSLHGNQALACDNSPLSAVGTIQQDAESCDSRKMLIP